MIRSILIRQNQIIKENLTLAEIADSIQNPDDLLWVNLEESNLAEINHVMSDIFHFHPLAIEDCVSAGYQTSKVDDFGSYLFIIANALQPGYELANMQTIEINCFLGTNFVVTHYHGSVMPPIDYVWKRIQRDSRIVSNGSDYLCHTILDNVVDEYMPLIDQMDEEIELLEDKVLAKPHPDTLQRILTLKHSVMTLRRIISPQREVMNSLSRDEYPQIDRQSRIYFRDIYDHLVRLQDMSDSIRDIATSAIDVYLNSTSLRLNEVMKALTIVSTIFLPMSFVAGVYGMNFHFMPELSSSWGYPLVWVVFISIPTVMLWYFKRRDWF